MQILKPHLHIKNVDNACDIYFEEIIFLAIDEDLFGGEFEFLK